MICYITPHWMPHVNSGIRLYALHCRLIPFHASHYCSNAVNPGVVLCVRLVMLSHSFFFPLLFVVLKVCWLQSIKWRVKLKLTIESFILKPSTMIVTRPRVRVCLCVRLSCHSASSPTRSIWNKKSLPPLCNADVWRKLPPPPRRPPSPPWEVSNPSPPRASRERASN